MWQCVTRIFAPGARAQVKGPRSEFAGPDRGARGRDQGRKCHGITGLGGPLTDRKAATDRVPFPPSAALFSHTIQGIDVTVSTNISPPSPNAKLNRGVRGWFRARAAGSSRELEAISASSIVRSACGLL